MAMGLRWEAQKENMGPDCMAVPQEELFVTPKLWDKTLSTTLRM